MFRDQSTRDRDSGLKSARGCGQPRLASCVSIVSLGLESDNFELFRLRARRELDYGQVDEILGEDPHAYLEGIARYCAQIHDAAHQSYISYPIESALPA
jgi:hypothetical protein